jgi:hypothetical protein
LAVSSAVFFISFSIPSCSFWTSFAASATSSSHFFIFPAGLLGQSGWVGIIGQADCIEKVPSSISLSIFFCFSSSLLLVSSDLLLKAPKLPISNHHTPFVTAWKSLNTHCSNVLPAFTSASNEAMIAFVVDIAAAFVASSSALVADWSIFTLPYSCCASVAASNVFANSSHFAFNNSISFASSVGFHCKSFSPLCRKSNSLRTSPHLFTNHIQATVNQAIAATIKDIGHHKAINAAAANQAAQATPVNAVVSFGLSCVNLINHSNNGLMIAISLSNTGIKFAFNPFTNLSNFSLAVSVSLAVLWVAHSDHFNNSIYSANSNLFSLTANANCGQAFAHNTSVAKASASLSVFASFRFLINPVNAVGISVPLCFANVFNHLFNQASIASLFTHSASNLLNNATLCSSENHNALSCTQ